MDDLIFVTVIPLPPRNVRCTGTGSGSISITWEAPENDGGSPVTHYHVETCRTTQMNYNHVTTMSGSMLKIKQEKARGLVNWMNLLRQ